MADDRSLKQIIKEHLDVCPGRSGETNTSDPQWIERLRFLTLALAGEAGEAANIVKKQWRGDASLRFQTELVGELANVLQYLSMLQNHLDVDLYLKQREQFLEFETRPEWAALKAWPLQERRVSHHVVEDRDAIHIEWRSGSNVAVPLNPLGSLTSRINAKLNERPQLQRPPCGYRTSKETIETLIHIGGVATKESEHVMFMGERLRAWGDYS